MALNTMLAGELPGPITAVDILDPCNEREFLDDTNPPDWMQTPEMRQAMSTLKAF